MWNEFMAKVASKQASIATRERRCLCKRSEGEGLLIKTKENILKLLRWKIK